MHALGCATTIPKNYLSSPKSFSLKMMEEVLFKFLDAIMIIACDAYVVYIDN